MDNYDFLIKKKIKLVNIFVILVIVFLIEEKVITGW
jgi:hypothetical protein